MPIDMICKYFLYCVLAMAVEVCGHSLSQSDSCDWAGSSSPKFVHGVRPVYLRCSQGTVRWNYPQGALRIVLRNGMSSKDFKACFRMAPGSNGARIYLTGHHKLHPIFGDSSNGNQSVKCVHSTEEHLVLFVEADPIQDPLKKRVLVFKYHLQKLPKTIRREDECRPCDNDELIQRFCSSDFVLRGSVSNLHHNTVQKRTELTVRVSKVYQDSDPSLFQQYSSDPGPNRWPKYVVLHRSLSCGTKPGSGEYLFFGAWTLGNPTLTCIPRYAEWKKVRRRAMRDGSSQCQLDL